MPKFYVKRMSCHDMTILCHVLGSFLKFQSITA